MTEYNPTGWETMSFFDCDAQMLQGKALYVPELFYAWSEFQKKCLTPLEWLL